jgi:hypothetical protein
MEREISWLGNWRAKNLHIHSPRRITMIRTTIFESHTEYRFRNTQTLFTFTSNRGFYVYKRGYWDSPFTKLLVLPPDHLNDISIQENLRLFSRSIHPLHPDLIGATPWYAASLEREKLHHTRVSYPSRRLIPYLYLYQSFRLSVQTQKWLKGQFKPL